MRTLLGAAGQAHSLAVAVLWEILWALPLGVGLSGAVQALVSKGELSRVAAGQLSFYAAMVAAGLLVELGFGAVGLVPTQRAAKVVEASIT